jgi:alpha-mannosidase
MKLSQSLGINEWKYAVMPHNGNWEEGNVFQEVEKFNLPFESAQTGKGGGALPKSLSFIEIKSDKISIAALKQCEKRPTVILRLFNPTLNEAETEINFHFPISEAWITNMNEERREKITIDKNSIRLNFGHKKIITLEVELKGD